MTAYYGHRLHRGFTLIELSIVFIVIGLVIGGVLVAKDLIKAAEIRSAVSDYQRYATAVNAFRLKYNALPGDMPDAVIYWGAQAGAVGYGTDSTCMALTYTTPSTGTATCNGNGNASVPATYEMMRFWQHLANAEMISGQYTGVSANGNTDRAHRRGLNCPASKFTNAGWSFYNLTTVSGSAYAFSGYYGHSFILGAESQDYDTVNAALKPEEAWNIDAKLDDGLPGKGFIKTRKSDPVPGGTPNCNTSSDPEVSVYNLTYSSPACSLYFSQVVK